MRSRYSAYVVHDTAYLLRTWHPRTRPRDLDASGGPDWQGLTVLAVDDGRDTTRWARWSSRPPMPRACCTSGAGS